MKQLIPILFLFLAFHVNATTYFIATNGNDANPGTQAQPFRNFSKINSLSLVAGDTVYIMPGTYSSGATSNSPQWCVRITGKNGTSTNPIVISAYPYASAARVTLDCSDFQHTSDFVGIQMETSSWFVFNRIRVTGIPQRVAGQVCLGWWFLNNAGNFLVNNCESDHIGNNGFRHDNTNNMTYLNCDAHHIDNPFDPGIQRHGGADGFGVYNAANTSTGTLYKKCRAYWCSDDGWDSNNFSRDITYDSCWAFWGGYVQDVFPLTHSQGGVNWGDGDGFKLGGDATIASSSNLRTAKNCVSFENFASGFDQNLANIGMTFYNNTTYSCLKAGFFVYTQTPSPMVVRNNLSYNNGFTQNFINGSTTQSNNSWNGAVTVTNADFALLTSTGVDGPRQANGDLPNLAYLHLATGSDLIAAGINVGIPFVPPAPNIGAFGTFGVAPVANAGPDQSIVLPPGATTLNGSASTGPITSYAWLQISGPGTSSIINPNTVTTTVNNLIQGSYVFRLTVTASGQPSSSDDMNITVDNPTVIKYYGKKL